MPRPRVEALRKVHGDWRLGLEKVHEHRILEEQFILKMRELREVETKLAEIQAEADVIELGIDSAGKSIHDAYETEDVPAVPGPPADPVPPVGDGSP